MGDGRATCYKSCAKAHKISSLGGGRGRGRGGTPRLENYNLGRWRRKLKGGGGIGEKRGVTGVKQKGKAEKGEKKSSLGGKRKGSGKGGSL
jgi:hypothetical protein